MYALVKAHMHSIPSLGSFPNVTRLWSTTWITQSNNIITPVVQDSWWNTFQKTRQPACGSRRSAWRYNARTEISQSSACGRRRLVCGQPWFVILASDSLSGNGASCGEVEAACKFAMCLLVPFPPLSCNERAASSLSHSGSSGWHQSQVNRNSARRRSTLSPCRRRRYLPQIKTVRLT